jgi:hypothetical protein
LISEQIASFETPLESEKQAMLAGFNQTRTTNRSRSVSSNFSATFSGGGFRDSTLDATTARVERMSKRRASLDKAVKLGMADPEALALLDEKLKEICAVVDKPQGRPRSARSQRTNTTRTRPTKAHDRPQRESLQQRQQANTCTHCNAPSRARGQTSTKKPYSKSPARRSSKRSGQRAKTKHKPAFDAEVIERNTRNAIEWASVRQAAIERARRVRESRVHGPASSRKRKGQPRLKLEQRIDAAEHIYTINIPVPTSPVRITTDVHR